MPRGIGRPWPHPPWVTQAGQGGHLRRCLAWPFPSQGTRGGGPDWVAQPLPPLGPQRTAPLRAALAPSQNLPARLTSSPNTPKNFACLMDPQRCPPDGRDHSGPCFAAAPPSPSPLLGKPRNPTRRRRTPVPARIGQGRWPAGTALLGPPRAGPGPRGGATPRRRSAAGGEGRTPETGRRHFRVGPRRPATARRRGGSSRSSGPQPSAQPLRGPEDTAWRSAPSAREPGRRVANSSWTPAWTRRAVCDPEEPGGGAH